ncbi:beta-barrel assembly-enhancing protease [Shewanella sedimentimangrovi]|uniref:Putative beta-barrel assembly-enhancing protease n=1 Tax=Shewanella sedimentimangrovi TaxID=2814293 RepID=A0ABX7R5B6_9GAMM|nr:M48 family metalloprotease [Shewanella sedimentimangrovi]QSX39044.1 M48 family metallopeptidase [Shewanella sedimentimangrovi]
MLTAATTALLSFATSQSFANNDLPDLGTAAVNTFSLEKEMQYGDAYMRVIRSSAPVLNDPVLSQYITELGNKLVAHATGVKTPFYFFMLRNDEINAFAFFGGHVGVHTGLFLNADSESELASVLAHEITHVTQRHLARSLEAQEKTAPATVAGMLGAILLTIAAPQAGMAALATTQALATQAKINYTRQHEKEADRIGMQILVDAGFDPEAAGDFFGKLASRYRFTTTPPQMLLTHPLPESRISEARNRANQYPHRFVPDNLNYQLAKARIQVRFSNYSDEMALSLFEKQLNRNSYAFESAALYGKALALLRLKRAKEAEVIIDKLLTRDANNLFYLDTKADLLLERKDYAGAKALLEQQRQLKPTSQVINANLANVYIEAGEAAKAIPVLEDMVFLDKQNPLPYEMMTQVYRQTGNQALEHFASAESMALAADYKGAVDQLNFAYRFTKDDPLQLARIEARIRQFREAEKALDALK